MRRTILTLALCALASHAHAGRVYKCAAGGQTIYQTVPCPPEQDTGVTRPIIGDPKLSWEERSRAQRDLQAARQRMQADAEQCEDLRLRRELGEVFGRTAPPHVEAAIKKACARR